MEQWSVSNTCTAATSLCHVINTHVQQYVHFYDCVVINFGMGTVAGGVASVVSHPLDVIRTRFVGQGEPKVIHHSLNQYIPSSHYIHVHTK